MQTVPTRDHWLDWAGLHIAEFPDLPMQRRRVWLSPHFVEQFDRMETWSKDQDLFEGPKAQVQYVLQHFAEGARRFQEGYDYTKLKLSSFPVYEFRTRDVRVFGFLLGRGEFCAILALPKSGLRKRSDYNWPIQFVINFKSELKIPPPKYSKERIDEIYR